jgi:hypothetical protein
MADMVNGPDHYKGDLCMKIIESKGWGIPFCLGNSFKYLFRMGDKHDNIEEDAKKARWYLDRAIGLMEKQNESTQGSDPNV